MQRRGAWRSHPWKQGARQESDAAPATGAKTSARAREPDGPAARRHAALPGQRPPQRQGRLDHRRSEEHTSELQSLTRISYAVFCLTKKNNKRKHITQHYDIK